MTATTVFIDKLPQSMSQLYYYIFFKGQTSYYISGHQCTVTRRCVHLQVIKDSDVCLF